MARFLCSTNTCTVQAAQLCHAAQQAATLAAQLAAVTAERDALAASLEAERTGKAFYEGLFRDGANNGR